MFSAGDWVRLVAPNSDIDGSYGTVLMKWPHLQDAYRVQFPDATFVVAESEIEHAETEFIGSVKLGSRILYRLPRLEDGQVTWDQFGGRLTEFKPYWNGNSRAARWKCGEATRTTRLDFHVVVIY